MIDMRVWVTLWRNLLWIAARYWEEDPEIIFDEIEADNPPRGYYYISTVNLR